MRMSGLFKVAVLCVFSALAAFGNSPTRIDVTARPEGAKVLLDGESKGVVPVSVFNVAAGKHLLRVEADRVQQFRRGLCDWDGVQK